MITVQVAVLAILCCSCRTKTTDQVIARVGATELTLVDALAHIDTMDGQSREHRLAAYAASWATRELLYQEARRSGIEDQDDFQRQVADTRRQLATEAFLMKFLAADSLAPNEDSLHAYYSVHRDEFLVPREMIQLNLAMFETRDRASAFAATLLRGAEWNAAVTTALADSPKPRVFMPEYYTQRTLYPPELWRVASALGVGELSFPVKTSAGFAILQPLAFVKEGKRAEFDLVREEVRQRFTLDRRRVRYEQLLGTLRTQTNVELLLNPASPSDTTDSRIHE